MAQIKPFHSVTYWDQWFKWVFVTFQESFLTRLTHADLRYSTWQNCWFYILRFVSHTRVYARLRALLTLRADLQYSHIGSVSPSCLLFSLSVFAGSLQSELIAVRGYIDAFCCVLCSSSVDLLVTGAYTGPEPHRPAWKERWDPFAALKKKKADWTSHFAEKS